MMALMTAQPPFPASGVPVVVPVGSAVSLFEEERTGKSIIMFSFVMFGIPRTLQSVGGRLRNCFSFTRPRWIGREGF